MYVMFVGNAGVFHGCEGVEGKVSEDVNGCLRGQHPTDLLLCWKCSMISKDRTGRNGWEGLIHRDAFVLESCS